MFAQLNNETASSYLSELWRIQAFQYFCIVQVSLSAISIYKFSSATQQVRKSIDLYFLYVEPKLLDHISGYYKDGEMVFDQKIFKMLENSPN